MLRRIGVVGLGYVGLPVAVAFGKKGPVIGYDINRERIESLTTFYDFTGEFSQEELLAADIQYTYDAAFLSLCDFIIVSVPTPIDAVNKPNLSALVEATITIGKHITSGTIIVYESTVYPGVTEEICIPLLEKYSGQTAGQGFAVGYSPERINPGDKLYTFENIVKVVAAQNSEVLEVIANLYSTVVKAGVFKASSIKVAEAAKVIENTQRDLNIALMNEIAIILNKLDINTKDVLETASTKWNFLNFTPGLVGGHCIGVDPYYLTYIAEKEGFHPQVILSGRRINDGMGEYIARMIVKRMIINGITVQGSTVIILGMTFKENISDLRNSKVLDIMGELKEYGVNVVCCDPYVSPIIAKKQYNVDLTPTEGLKTADAVVLSVPHHDFLQLGEDRIASMLPSERSGIIADIKGVLNPDKLPEHIAYWRL